MTKRSCLFYIAATLPPFLSVELPARAESVSTAVVSTIVDLPKTNAQFGDYLQFAQDNHGNSRNVNPNKRGGAASAAPPQDNFANQPTGQEWQSNPVAGAAAGASTGAAQGSAAAGPVGAIVGGALGTATGTLSGTGNMITGAPMTGSGSPARACPPDYVLYQGYCYPQQ